MEMSANVLAELRRRRKLLTMNKAQHSLRLLNGSGYATLQVAFVEHLAVRWIDLGCGRNTWMRVSRNEVMEIDIELEHLNFRRPSQATNTSNNITS